MNDKERMDAQEQLNLISSLVQGSRTSLQDNCFPFVVWGVVVPVCYMFTRIMVMIRRENLIPYIWIIGCCIGAVLVFLFYCKKSKDEKATYLSSRIMGVLWGSLMLGAFGLGLCLGISSSAADNSSLALSQGLAILAVLIGIGYSVTSVLVRYWPVAICGGIWMLGGFSCMFLSGPTASTLIVCLAVALELVPGLFLMYRQRRARAK